jgi:hypothetical protein
MVGTYSKHTRRYVNDSALMNGHWYVDPSSGELYIVPTIGRAEGPAGDKLDQLNRLYGPQALTEVSTEVIANLTGLRLVPWFERKFDTTNGYYVA